VSLAKAWKEMGHRYLAATLGLVIVLLAAWTVTLLARRCSSPRSSC
jgi:heme A synthase